MKKYFAQLRPLERRLVVGVGVVLIVVLNWWFIWPEFSDFSNDRTRLEKARSDLAKYRTAASQIPDLKKQLEKFESDGNVVPPDDQAVNFMRMVQSQAAQCNVALQSSSRPITHTNDVFFIEQWQNINVLAPEAELVDFLYKLGAGTSLIRVRDLSLQPDPPHQRLAADIRLVASYQKSAPGAAVKTPTSTAKAK